MKSFRIVLFACLISLTSCKSAEYAKGDQGPKGDPGQSVTGPQGPQGNPGKDGKNGKDAVCNAHDGKNGTNGTSVGFSVTSATKCKNGGYTVSLWTEVNGNNVFDSTWDLNLKKFDLCNGENGTCTTCGNPPPDDDCDKKDPGHHYGHTKNDDKYCGCKHK